MNPNAWYRFKQSVIDETIANPVYENMTRRIWIRFKFFRYSQVVDGVVIFEDGPTGSVSSNDIEVVPACVSAPS